MGNYLKKALQQTAGDWQTAVRMAAAAWYGGEDDMKNYNANFGGKGKEPTFKEYTSSVLGRVKKNLGGGGGEIELTNIFTEAMEKQAAAIKKVQDQWDKYLESIKPVQTEQQKLAEILSNPVVQQSLAAMDETTRGWTLTLLKSKAIAEDYADAIKKLGDNAERIAEMEFDLGLVAPDRTGGAAGTLGGPGDPELSPTEEFGFPPPPKKPWEDFWATMSERMSAWKNSLPSIKEAIGENLLNSMQKIGDVFADAVMRWDGTAKGFFKSLAQGFKALVQEIIAQLIRIMIMKAVTAIGNALAGAFGGGGGGIANQDIGGGINIYGNALAEGGKVSGAGTSTSDSIFARLSNGEFVMKAAAVKHWGVGIFERLNAMKAPSLAMAGGGYVGSAPSIGGYGSMSSISNNSTSQVFNIHIQGGGGHQQTIQSVKQGIREATMQMERERMRGK